jgi:hypothetical protein
MLLFSRQSNKHVFAFKKEIENEIFYTEGR